MTTTSGHGASVPYDWDHYEDDFIPSPAYVDQEAALDEVLWDIPFEPDAVLEVGPGLGRITRRLVDLWPRAKIGLVDVSEAAIEKTSVAVPDHEFAYHVGRIQDTTDWKGVFPFAAPGGFGLVVAVEVLLHVPPQEVEFAARNLLAATRAGGYLLTCDWTEPLPDEKGVRVQNYRHDYPQLFRYIGASVISARRVGLQTIFAVQP